MAGLEQQIETLQAEIARLESELAGLEADLLDIQRELGEFIERYDRLIQPKLDRLEAVRAVIYDLEQQINQPTAPNSAPYSHEEMGGIFPPDYVPVEEQYRRTWQVPRQQAEAAPDPPLPFTMASSDRPDGGLKQLYRALVRRFHPDLVTDPAERDHRNRLMAKINEAYTRRDQAALQALADQPVSASIAEPLATLQLRQLQQVFDQLARRVARLKQERADLFNSDMMWLKIQSSLAARTGRDLLREMADNLEKEYVACLKRLDDLRGA